MYHTPAIAKFHDETTEKLSYCQQSELTTGRRIGMKAMWDDDDCESTGGEVGIKLISSSHTRQATQTNYAKARRWGIWQSLVTMLI